MKIQETLVALVIVGILAAIIYPNAARQIERGHEAQQLGKIGDLLRNGDLEAANELTWQIIFRSADKNKNEILTQSEYDKHLDCTLVQQIDGAWGVGTAGHFGFTAQSKVRREVNREMASQEYSVHDKWQYVAKRLGWGDEAKKQGYSGYSPFYSEEAPYGHLPVHWPTKAFKTYKIEDRVEPFATIFEKCIQD